MQNISKLSLTAHNLNYQLQSQHTLKPTSTVSFSPSTVSNLHKHRNNCHIIWRPPGFSDRVLYISLSYISPQNSCLALSLQPIKGPALPHSPRTAAETACTPHCTAQHKTQTQIPPLSVNFPKVPLRCCCAKDPVPKGHTFVSQ